MLKTESLLRATGLMNWCVQGRHLGPNSQWETVAGPLTPDDADLLADKWTQQTNGIEYRAIPLEDEMKAELQVKDAT